MHHQELLTREMLDHCQEVLQEPVRQFWLGKRFTYDIAEDYYNCVDLLSEFRVVQRISHHVVKLHQAVHFLSQLAF